MTYSDSCHPGTRPAGSLRLSKIAPCNLVTRDFLSRALRAACGCPNSFPTNLSHKIAGAYFEQLQLACVASELQGCSEYQPLTQLFVFLQAINYFLTYSDSCHPGTRPAGSLRLS